MERTNTGTLHFLYSHSIAGSLGLPLGELSPQVTERVLQPVWNDNINLLAHITKIPVNITVGKSQKLQLFDKLEFIDSF